MGSSTRCDVMPSDPAVNTTAWFHLGGGEPAPPIFLDGTVVRIGFYGDTLPRLIITMKKEQLKSFKFEDGERTSVRLSVLGAEYRAGVRTTTKSASVMISPDLEDCSGNRLRLVEVLYSSGVTGSRASLQIENRSGEITITIGPSC